MRYIKPFNEAKRGEPNREKIEKFLDRYEVYDFSINPDGTVDLMEDFYFGSDRDYTAKLKKLPIKFGNIQGEFDLSEAYELTTLEGFPRSCEAFYFRTYHNGGKGIKSMVGGPVQVSGDYSVCDSNLTSFEGIPEYIGGDLDVSHNPITSLRGAPKEVGGSFQGIGLAITDLEGCPEVIGEDLVFFDTNLTSLKGFPKKVRNAHISTNSELGIWDPTGLRDSECRMLFCRNEPLRELIDLFNRYRGVRNNYDDLENREEIFQIFKESLDYNYVKGLKRKRPQIDLFRLKEALAEFDIDHGEPFKMICYDFVNERGEIVNFMGHRINK